MGLIWGDEYSITTAAVSSPLFTDEATADPWKLIPLKAAMNNVSVSRALKNEIFTGIGIRIEQLYRRASDEDKFSEGLLNHTLLSEAAGSKETKAYLTAQHGETVSVEYHHMNRLNLEHVGHEYLAESMGYNPFRNTSDVQSAIKGFPVYVEHMELRLQVDPDGVLKPVDELPEWQIPPSQQITPWYNPFIYAPVWEYSTTEVSAIVLHFAWLGDTPITGTPTALAWNANGVPALAVPPDPTSTLVQTHGYSFEAAYGLTSADINDFIRRYSIVVTLSSLGYDQDEDYFQTKYFTNVASAPLARYFTHRNGAGTIASIEDTAELGNNTPTFFPLIFFRRDYTTIASAANAESTEYKQNAFICKRLGVDYQSFADQLLDSEEVDEATLSQVFVTFGIPVNSDKPMGLRYLYEFFYWLNLDNNDRASISVYGDGNWFHDERNPVKVIHFSDSSVNMRLEYVGTATALKFGNIGIDANTPIGTCVSDLLTQPQYYTKRRRNNYGGSDGGDAHWETVTLVRQIPVWRYRKQISATYYREVLVAEPRLSYLLLSVNDTSKQWAYVLDDKDLLIPLSHDLAHEYFTLLERTRLYAESVHIQSNSYSKDKLSWYETQRFATVMLITSFILIAASAGSMSATVQAAYQTIFAFVGNAAAAVVLTALVIVGAQVGLARVFSLVVAEVGTEWGSIGAIILTVAAAYAAANGMPSAQNWNMAANALAEGTELQAQEDIIQFDRDLSQLSTELQDFMDIKNEYDNEIDIRKNLMEAIGLGSVFNPYETPQEYFDRSFSGTDSLEVSVSGPEISLQTALMLPTIQNTLGENL